MAQAGYSGCTQTRHSAYCPFERSQSYSKATALFNRPQPHSKGRELLSLCLARSGMPSVNLVAPVAVLPRARPFLSHASPSYDLGLGGHHSMVDQTAPSIHTRPTSLSPRITSRLHPGRPPRAASAPAWRLGIISHPRLQPRRPSRRWPSPPRRLPSRHAAAARRSRCRRGAA